MGIYIYKYIYKYIYIYNCDVLRPANSIIFRHSMIVYLRMSRIVCWTPARKGAKSCQPCIFYLRNDVYSSAPYRSSRFGKPRAQRGPRGPSTRRTQQSDISATPRCFQQRSKTCWRRLFSVYRSLITYCCVAAGTATRPKQNIHALKRV